jgi:hypothetical protein
VPSVIKRARYLDKLIDTHHQVGGIEDDVEDEVVVADAGGLPAGDQEDDAKVEANLDNISQSSSGVDDNDDTSEEENEVSISKPTTKANTSTTQPIKRKASYENNDAAVQPISFGKPVVNKKQQNETSLDKYITLMAMDRQSEKQDRKKQQRLEENRHKEVMQIILPDDCSRNFNPSIVHQASVSSRCLFLISCL